MLQILLVGPKVAQSRARTALAAKGYTVVNLKPREHPHGFAPEGDECFIKCQADDLDAVAATVAPFRFRHRASYHLNQDVEVVGRAR